jgi:glycosyltransferase involved in cell wall biosynthesis
VKGSAQAPDRRVPHIVMVVDNDVVTDTRVRKEATSLGAAGYRVTVVGKGSEGQPAEERIGTARIVRVPVPPTVLQEHWDRRQRRRQRRIPLIGYRSRSAYDAARRRIQARRRDAEAEAARAIMRQQGTAASRRFSVTRQLRLAGLNLKEILVRGRGVVRHRMNRAAGTAWQRWDEFQSQRVRGVRWRRVIPGLDDFEIAHGPVIDSLGPDAVHAHDVFSIGIAARAVGRARLAGRQVALVYDAHEFVPGLPRHAGRTPRYAAAVESLEREYIRDADRILTVSPAIAAAIRTHYRLDRTPDVILNIPMATQARANVGEPAQSVRASCGLGPEVPLLVYSGGLKRVRGVDVVVRAMTYLPNEHLAVVCVPNARAALVEELRRLADRLGVSERVHFVDPVPPDQVVGYLAAADIGLHPLLGGIPNHEMALPNKLFEYLHAGLPMVVTDLRELGAFVREHGLGETFRSGDPVDLAETVVKVLANPQPYREAAAKPELRAEYSWQRQAELLQATYDHLLRR